MSSAMPETKNLYRLRYPVPEDSPPRDTTMADKPQQKSVRLQELIHRRDKVLAVLHPPTAAHARIMEMAGCEALFVGTGGVVGAYTGPADVGTATMTECITIAGWIVDSVSIPVIIDGDTGHGGIMAGAPDGTGMYSRGHRRNPHRRPADRGQAQDAECRRRSCA